MSMRILGWGTSLPCHSITQTRAAEVAQRLNGLTPEQSRLLPALYRRTGVKVRSSILLRGGAAGESRQDFFRPAAGANDRGPTTRERMVQYEQNALPLALPAAHAALESSGMMPNEITHLITVSCSGFAAPGVDIGIMKAMGLAPSVQRTHVGFMGCHAALNGLRVAGAFVDMAIDARVLLCAVELCSLHYQYGWNPQQVVANALFSDGAAALVGAALGQNAQEEDAWRLAATGAQLFPDSEEAMVWRVGDHGFEMTLSPRVPDLIGAHLRPWLTRWLARQCLGLEQVRSWAIHPGGPRILQSVEQALALDLAATADSRAVLAQCGNMSSPTILFILDRLVRARAPRPCVALGFGPGLVAEAALFV